MNREVRVPPETPYGAAVEALLADTSLALIRHLDFEPSPEVCSFRDHLEEKACTQDAQWQGVCQGGCGATSTCCKQHRLWLLSSPVVFRCHRCGLRGVALEVVRFVPIRFDS